MENVEIDENGLMVKKMKFDLYSGLGILPNRECIALYSSKIMIWSKIATERLLTCARHDQLVHPRNLQLPYPATPTTERRERPVHAKRSHEELDSSPQQGCYQL